MKPRVINLCIFVAVGSALASDYISDNWKWVALLIAVVATTVAVVSVLKDSEEG